MKRLVKCLEQLKVENAAPKAITLRKYMELVLERNKQVNLTAITNPAEFVEKHYVDSLACAGLEEFRRAETVIDVGTGGGFPGVPLAVCFPEKDFVLVDSLNKRIRIIQEFCGELGIANVTAIHGRAEELGRQADLRDRFDLCVSRAVADLRVLSEYCLPFVKAGGWFVAYKGADCAEEIADAKRAIRLLGGLIDRIVPAAVALGGEADWIAPETEVPGSTADRIAPATKTPDGAGGHQLVVIRKPSPTPPAYPRKPGVPAKKPL